MKHRSKDADFAWFMSIACFLNSFSPGSGLSCSAFEEVNSEVAVDLLELDLNSSFLALFCPEFHFFNAIADMYNAL